MKLDTSSRAHVLSSLRLSGPSLLLLFNLKKQGTVDVRKNASESDCGPDERVKLFVAADSELEMTRRYALDLEVLGGVLLHETR